MEINQEVRTQIRMAIACYKKEKYVWVDPCLESIHVADAEDAPAGYFYAFHLDPLDSFEENMRKAYQGCLLIGWIWLAILLQPNIMGQRSILILSRTVIVS
jgi:hypothetical protein